MHRSPLLLLHIASGLVALVAGTAALVVRKGGRRHALSGILFSVCMLSLAASGIMLGIIKSQIGNVIGGSATLYLIATAWTAARSPNARTGWFDWTAVTFGLAVGTGCVAYGYRVASGKIPEAGVPSGMSFFFGAVVLLAAAGDLRMLARGGLTGRARIARHLWRMCFGLFIASGSFFMARQGLFPAFVRDIHLPEFLTVLPLLLLAFWMVRIRVAKGTKGELVRALQPGRKLVRPEVSRSSS